MMKAIRKSSIGVHTFSFFQYLTDEEHFTLTGDFAKYMKITGEISCYPIKDKEDSEQIVGWEYWYNYSKGIRWRLLSIKINKNYTIHGVLVIITPKVLIEQDYISVAEASDLEKVEELFNIEAKKISPILMGFGLCPLNRGDIALTIDLAELCYDCTPEQMMALIKSGSIPEHLTERGEYNYKSHRKIPDKNSFYLESDSVVINFYWKHPKINKKHPNFCNKDDFQFVIRFEIQCKHRKLYDLSKKNKHNSRYFKSYDDMSEEELFETMNNGFRNPSIPIDVMLSDEMLAKIIRKYLNKVIRKGDYLTLDGARWMVEAHNFNRNKRERLIFALETVSKYKGIANAKSKLIGEDLTDFKRSLNDLDDILVNPVTIPQSWNMEHIPNPLRAYYNHITEEQIVPKIELVFEKILTEYLSSEYNQKR